MPANPKPYRKSWWRRALNAAVRPLARLGLTGPRTHLLTVPGRRFLPDKAIDLVDESASRLRMQIDSSPVELEEAERRARQLEIELAAMANESDDVQAPIERELAEAKCRRDELGARWSSRSS